MRSPDVLFNMSAKDFRSGTVPAILLMQIAPQSIDVKLGERSLLWFMDSIQKWFDELYIKNSKKMISIAMRLGFPQGEAEELVHDAFLLLLSKADRFQAGHENPGGFLMESLKNLMGTRFRHKKVIQFIPYDDMPETSTTDTYFPSLKDRLPANLCEEDKLLLIARYEEQLPYAELSKRLGISPKQCAFKVFQARKRLQKIIEEEENF